MRVRRTIGTLRTPSRRSAVDRQIVRRINVAACRRRLRAHDGLAHPDAAYLNTLLSASNCAVSVSSIRIGVTDTQPFWTAQKSVPSGCGALTRSLYTFQ